MNSWRRCEQEDDTFIRRIDTGNEPRAHHYDPENKHQSMEFRHINSPTPKTIHLCLGGKSYDDYFLGLQRHSPHIIFEKRQYSPLRWLCKKFAWISGKIAECFYRQIRSSSARQCSPTHRVDKQWLHWTVTSLMTSYCTRRTGQI